MHYSYSSRFFFQAEDGIRDGHVTGVQTCALPIYFLDIGRAASDVEEVCRFDAGMCFAGIGDDVEGAHDEQIGRASCRERVWMTVVEGAVKKKRGEGGGGGAGDANGESRESEERGE